MKKLLLTTLCLLPFLIKAQDKFEITGHLPAAVNGSVVLLTYKNSEGKSVRDSATIKEGKFTFTGTTAFGNTAGLEIRPVKQDSVKRTGYDYQEFELEKGKTFVNGKDSMANAVISGTKAQSDYHEYHSQMDPLRAQYQEIANRYHKASAAKDSAELKKISADATPLVSSMLATLDNFIAKHPDSYYTADLVYSNKMQIVDDKFDPIYQSLSKRLLSSFSGQKITEKYNKAKQFGIGKTIDFTENKPDGTPFTLSSLRGKYVLVDFWASWCVPCRAENPHLLKAYNALKDKNFEIVSVSIDDKRQSWLTAIAQDKMPWIQVSELKGAKAAIAVQLGITAIPQNVLIDPKGIIIAKDLRGEDVTGKLSAFIK